MIPTVAHEVDPDDVPTRRSDNFPTATITLAARVDRLAELAQERLLIDPDEHTLLAAAEDLAQIRSLCAGVLR